ncbi:hypothetical protein IMY05_C4238001800 [Salix suchowensis]|nr:hypothetical protein IMY05_C4238001800 [Salix suchowensis]
MASFRAPPPTPVISRQLSFGTINSEGIDPSLNEANPSQNKSNASSPQKILSRAPKLVSAAAGDEQSTAVTPVKKGKRKSTLKASKKAVLSPKEAKWQVRQILRNDTAHVLSAGSLGESDLSDDELDKLWLDTPKSSLVSKSLVLSMLDVEAEEADEGDDEMEQDEQEDQKEDEQEDTDSVAKGKVKGKAKAKAPSKRVEAPPASASQQPSSSSASSDPLANIPPSIFAWEMGSLADILAALLTTHLCDNPLNPDSQSNGSHAVTGHVELLDKAVFTAIHPSYMT